MPREAHVVVFGLNLYGAVASSRRDTSRRRPERLAHQQIRPNDQEPKNCGLELAHSPTSVRHRTT